jgi:N-formylglutamate deformylase
MTEAVDALLADQGRCVIIDLHSYPRDPLPYELDQTARRPAVCLGTDEFHTPEHLLDVTIAAFTPLNDDLAIDTPFAGTYVPIAHYGHDRRVTSIMIELRRDLYLPADGPDPTALARIATCLAALVDAATNAP